MSPFVKENTRMFGRRARPTPAFALMTAGLTLVAALVLLPSTTMAHASETDTTPSAVPGAWHLRLLRADPPIDSTVVKSPAVVRLWFSEPVRLKTTSVKITGPSGAAVGLGQLSRGAAAAAPVVAKVLNAMAPGRYTLAWRAMGRDSHIVKGHYTFTVAAGKAGAGR
jgi:methionine-rich copper-binding protein CopC